MIDMALERKIEIVADFVEKVKDFITDKLKPNMTLENVKEVVSPHLDELIIKNTKRGLKYNNGRFSVKYVDEQHFQFEFEMYFQDAAGKWHKCANDSEKRDAEILEKVTWSTIKALKVVSFPIEPPTFEP